MGKMINVKVVSDCGGEMPLLSPLLQAEKKCSLVQVERERQNITEMMMMGRCNSSNKTSSYIKTTSSPPLPIITEEARWISSSNPKRTKKFSRLSSPHPPPPSSLLPQLNHFIDEEDGAEESSKAAPHSVITSIKGRITSCRNSGSRTFNNCSSFNTSNTTTLSSSSSLYPMAAVVSLTKGLVTSAAAAVHVLFIPFLLFIVTMPVSGLATDMLPKTPSSHHQLSLTSSSSSPSFYTSSSSPFPSSSVLSSSSTVKSTVVSSSSLYGTRPLENHHYHPLSILSSSSSSSHFLDSDSPHHLADQPANDKQQQVPASGPQPHTCYVCLPPDKTSRGAEEILSIFPEETRKHIPDCASFGSQTANHFEFKCPPEYVGCLLRIHGKNESRSCGRLPLNDCKTANSVEMCYCTGALCNGNRPEILLEETESDERVRTQLEDEKEERETRKIWQKNLETDDEDLLGPPQHPPSQVDIDGMQDDTGDYGSGSEPPPGVIPHYTSTPKPTLIPNIRPDTRTTTPASTSGAPPDSKAFLFRFRVPFTITSVTISNNFASLVPLLLPVVLILKMWDLTSLQLNL